MRGHARSRGHARTCPASLPHGCRPRDEPCAVFEQGWRAARRLFGAGGRPRSRHRQGPARIMPKRERRCCANSVFRAWRTLVARHMTIDLRRQLHRRRRRALSRRQAHSGRDAGPAGRALRPGPRRASQDDAVALAGVKRRYADARAILSAVEARIGPLDPWRDAQRHIQKREPPHDLLRPPSVSWPDRERVPGLPCHDLRRALRRRRHGLPEEDLSRARHHFDAGLARARIHICAGGTPRAPFPSRRSARRRSSAAAPTIAACARITGSKAAACCLR